MTTFVVLLLRGKDILSILHSLGLWNARDISEIKQVEQIKEKIIEMVETNKDQRRNPRELMRSLNAEFGASPSQVREALNDLIRERKLVFTYRSPYTYVEIPCQERAGRSHPMRVILDEKGDPWICDYDVDPAGDLAAQGCWQLRDNSEESG